MFSEGEGMLPCEAIPPASTVPSLTGIQGQFAQIQAFRLSCLATCMQHLPGEGRCCLRADQHACEEGLCARVLQVGVLNDVLTNVGNVVRKGRLGPGQTVCADLAAGEFKEHSQIAKEVRGPCWASCPVLSRRAASREHEQSAAAGCAWSLGLMQTMGTECLATHGREGLPAEACTCMCAQVGTRAPFKEWLGGSVRLRDLGATGYTQEPAMSAAQVLFLVRQALRSCGPCWSAWQVACLIACMHDAYVRALRAPGQAEQQRLKRRVMGGQAVCEQHGLAPVQRMHARSGRAGQEG